MKRARKRGDGVGHGFGLLRDEGVAGVGNYDDGDAIAERGFQHAGEFARGNGVVFGLQVEDARGAACEPVVDGRGAQGGVLGFVGFGVPAAEPNMRIVSRREECKLQIAQAVGFREREVSAFFNGFAHFGRDGRLVNAGRDFSR